MTLAIGFHSWSPGLGRDFKSADPSHAWIEPLFEYYFSLGWNPVFIGDQHPAYGLDHDAGANAADRLDIGIFYWRTAFPDTPKFKSRNLAAARQNQLIGQLRLQNKPVIVYDGDMWITASERDFLLSIGCLLVGPFVHPPKGYQTLYYPFVYDNREEELAKTKKNFLVYVGNNYDRYTLTKKYLAFTGEIEAHRPEVHIYGNWLEPTSGDRQAPDKVTADFPYATFMGRSDQRSILKILSEASATIHLAKATYCRTGFLALRWQEAVAARTPALVPVEWKLSREVLGRVDSRIAVRQAMLEIGTSYWQKTVLESQETFVRERSKMERWKDLVEIALG